MKEKKFNSKLKNLNKIIIGTATNKSEKENLEASFKFLKIK